MCEYFGSMHVLKIPVTIDADVEKSLQIHDHIRDISADKYHMFSSFQIEPVAVETGRY